MLVLQRSAGLRQQRRGRGGTVAGGRVIADWPGLRTERLYQSRDLYPTPDCGRSRPRPWPPQFGGKLPFLDDHCRQETAPFGHTAPPPVNWEHIAAWSIDARSRRVAGTSF